MTKAWYCCLVLAQQSKQQRPPPQLSLEFIMFSTGQSWILELHALTRKEKGLKTQNPSHSKLAALYLHIIFYYFFMTDYVA